MIKAFVEQLYIGLLLFTTENSFIFSDKEKVHVMLVVKISLAGLVVSLD